MGISHGISRHWLGDFCYLIFVTLSTKNRPKFMITTIYVGTSLLTGFLIVLGIIELLNSIKVKKIFPKLLFDLGQKSQSEIQEMISAEMEKEDKSKIKILALQKVIDHRFSEPKPTFISSVLDFSKLLVGLAALPLFILFYVIKITLLALIPTVLIGGLIFLLSLVITIIQFNWIFIGIIFAFSFIVFSVKELIKHYG